MKTSKKNESVYKMDIMATVRRDKEAMFDEDHFLNLIISLYESGVKHFRINLAKFDASELELVKKDIKRSVKYMEIKLKLYWTLRFRGKRSGCV